MQGTWMGMQGTWMGMQRAACRAHGWGCRVHDRGAEGGLPLAVLLPFPLQQPLVVAMHGQGLLQLGSHRIQGRLQAAYLRLKAALLLGMLRPERAQLRAMGVLAGA